MPIRKGGGEDEVDACRHLYVAGVAESARRRKALLNPSAKAQSLQI
jgi:hypothetical protein